MEWVWADQVAVPGDENIIQMSYVNSLCDIYQKINLLSNSQRYPYLGLMI